MKAECNKNGTPSFCNFCLVPPVVENFEPFAPKWENWEKREPFQTSPQKCEPFASLRQKRIPKVRPLSRFRRAAAHKCEPFASLRQKREPFGVFGERVPESANPLRVFAKSANPFLVLARACPKVQTLCESSPKARTLCRDLQALAKRANPLFNPLRIQKHRAITNFLQLACLSARAHQAKWHRVRRFTALPFLRHSSAAAAYFERAFDILLEVSQNPVFDFVLCVNKIIENTSEFLLVLLPISLNPFVKCVFSDASPTRWQETRFPTRL